MKTLQHKTIAFLAAAVALSFATPAAAQQAVQFKQAWLGLHYATDPDYPFYYWSYFNGCAENDGFGGGTAWRWAGAGKPSPIEKFEQAFGKPLATADMDLLKKWAKCAFNAKIGCKEGNRMKQECLDKAENKKKYSDCGAITRDTYTGLITAITVDGKKLTINNATAHEVANQGCGNYGADMWWGICHGAAPMGALVAEPMKAAAYKGVTFEPGDIRAIGSAIFTSTNLVRWDGCRNDGPGRTCFCPASGGSSTPGDPTYNCENRCPKCPSAEFAANDVTPRAFLAHYGTIVADQARKTVIDISSGPEVWNQTSAQYKVTCSAGGTGCAAGEQAQTCETTFWWSDDRWRPEPLGATLPHGNNPTHDAWFPNRKGSFTICVKDGIITGDGKWNWGSGVDADARQPDFMWAPSGRGGGGGSNPYVSKAAEEFLTNVHKASVGTQTQPPSPSTEKVEKKTMTLAIADASGSTPGALATTPAMPIGAGVTGKIGTFSICIEMNPAHTWRKDLVIKAKYGTDETTISDRAGGGSPWQNGEAGCFSVATFTGKPIGGSFTASFQDFEARDTGTVSLVSVKWTKQ